MDLFQRKKKKTELDKEADETYEVDEDSDLPVHEPFINQKKIRKMGLQ
jgi:CRISPR/Cas system CMR-associated protein Cmr3 (group 5 of RAMP superfamily)